MAGGRTFVVLDVGGSTVTAARVRSCRIDGDPTTVSSRQDESVGEIVAHFVRLIADVVSADTTSVVIAIPDPFDFAAGVSLMEHKFAALRGVDLGAELRARTGLDAVFVHDAAAAAVGMWVEQGRPVGTFGAVTLGTGVGSALLVDGTPQPGFDQLWATEYLDGTFEDVVSTRGLRADHAARSSDDITVAEIAVRASHGDEAALAALHWYGHHLGLGMARYFHAAAPDVIAVAGGITGAWAQFVDPMSASYADRGGTARLVRSTVEHPALVGAAALAEARRA
ncbi:MAG: hypothetical protein CL424_03865 [Acidimicrobiaceae bacterium]|nr:hypothetical protein [Acidimicrobiaceae bacterium]